MAKWNVTNVDTGEVVADFESSGPGPWEIDRDSPTYRIETFSPGYLNDQWRVEEGFEDLTYAQAVDRITSRLSRISPNLFGYRIVREL